MKVSVEVPVFKGGWLRPCIESVLSQTSNDWSLSLLWDGGDQRSREILERLERRNDPRIRVYYGDNRGIAGARRFLSERSVGDYILPLDDDDALPAHAIESFLRFADDKPWASVMRARRKYIDESGRVVEMSPWFPFEPRHYQYGMVTDPFNHSQPYLIRRSAYERTAGWEGFPDLLNAGEDCDIFLKLEEVGSIELLDECLYYYRINPQRASKVLTDEAAFEMWRRLADKTIARLGLPLRRLNQKQPFRYQRLPRPQPALEQVDFVVLGDEPPGGEVSAAVRALEACAVPPQALHRVSRGSGAAAGRNRGFASTTRPLVCFVDDDVAIDSPEALGVLLGALDAGADLAAPRIVAAGGGLYSGAPSFEADGRPSLGSDGDARRASEVAGAPWLPAAFLMVRREVVKAVGGFDEAWNSEVASAADFSLKARQRGFQCSYAGTAQVSRERTVPHLVDDSELATLVRKWAGQRQLLAAG